MGGYQPSFPSLHRSYVDHYFRRRDNNVRDNNVEITTIESVLLFPSEPRKPNVVQCGATVVDYPAVQLNRCCTR